MASYVVVRRCSALAVVIALFVGALLPAVQGQALAPAPSPTTGDGAAIDQGIAYVLLFVALVLTYLIHPLDAVPYNLF